MKDESELTEGHNSRTDGGHGEGEQVMTGQGSEPAPAERLMAEVLAACRCVRMLTRHCWSYSRGWYSDVCTGQGQSYCQVFTR